MTTFSQIDALIAKKSLLLHPFYVRWSKGELTKDELRTYAKEYFRLVERIPGIVARVSDRVKDMELKGKIAENIREEQEHVELWKRFAKSLDVSEEELMAYKASDMVEQAIQSIEAVCERSAEEGIAAMYALEAELPAIAATKKQGLQDFYDLTSDDAHIYFDEHLKEEKHLEVWKSVDLSDSAIAAADASLNAQNKVLDGVCEQCGIAMHC